MWALYTTANRKDREFEEEFALERWQAAWDQMSMWGMTLEECDWIIAPRSDDHSFNFCSSFFHGRLTVNGLVRAIQDCSLGSQLVIKTTRALECFSFQKCERFISDSYMGLYNEQVEDKTKNAHKYIRANYNTWNFDYPNIIDFLNKGRFVS